MLPSNLHSWRGALIAIAGVGGLIGFLVAALRVPEHQTALRWAALIWFLACGLANALVDRKPRGSRSRR